MPSIRRSAFVSAAMAALLAVTATACGPDDTTASATPGASAAQSGGPSAPALLSGLPTRLQELEKWKKGDWKKWDHWARQASQFANPVIKDLWKPKRLAQTQAKDQTLPVPSDIGKDQGITDPTPPPIPATAVSTPYHANDAAIGKIFFDTPQGSFVCSGTVVEDPAHPAKSNLVWTAGHCVHRGAQGGWYRNIVFVPSYNDHGLEASQVADAAQQEITPYGAWWADWAQTSSQWISTGAESGGSGSPYDFAVLHVKSQNGKSLQETVGAALPVWFNAPAVSDMTQIGAWGYPAAPPYDGARMFSCSDRPGRLSLTGNAPTEYRIGCTMTGGSSGGGWFAREPNGQLALVSNTSIGPADSTWLAGPHLGPEAQGAFDAISEKFAGSQ
jgi:V8-like Glu-specific endopeptidase